MKENKFHFGKFNFAKFTAILCVLISVISLVAFINSEPFWMTEDYTTTKKEIKETKQRLEELPVEIENYQEKYDKAYADNKSEIEKLETALIKANTKLNKECSADSFAGKYRSYFGYYWIYRGSCDEDCEPLHEKVDKAEKNLNNFKDRIHLTTYEEKIEDLKQETEETEDKLVDLKRDFKELSGYLTKAWFLLLAIILCCAGLAGLAVSLFMEKYGKYALISVGSLALGSLLNTFLFPNVIATSNYHAADTIFLNPFAWSIVIMAMFAVIFIKREGRRRVFRILAVVFSVIMLLTSVITASGYIENVIGFIGMFLFYVVTMILVSFVLVPIDFTEYIGIAKHIFLSLITLGIWLFVWNYNVTKNLNKVSSVQQRKPVCELLLFMFLPFYSIYWMYKTAEYVELYGIENGRQDKISVLCLIFTLVSPLFATVLIQDKINLIVGKPE